MRFTGERVLQSPVEELWAALHDTEVLAAVIPGVEELVPLGAGQYAATLAARVGPLADTYRGAFDIVDVRPGQELEVRVEGRGRLGRLAVQLRVRLEEGRRPVTTALRYEAQATVGGLVARLGNATLTVAGGHLTGSFFRDLDRSLCQGARTGRVAALV